MQPETLFKRKGRTRLFVVDGLYKKAYTGYVKNRYEEETHKKVDLNPFISFDFTYGTFGDTTSAEHKDGLIGLIIDTCFVDITAGFKTHKKEALRARGIGFEENKKFEEYLNRAKLLRLPA
jgi:hypothetical protein